MMKENSDYSCPLKSNDVDQFEEHLNTTTLGSYTRNLAIIRLSRDASYWFEENEPTIDRLAVFIHEYVHYLHNFSTIAGIYDFIAQIRLARCFMQSVGMNGRSRGISAISPEAVKLYEGTLVWQAHIRGDQKAPFNILLHGKNAIISFKTVGRSSSTIQVPNQDIPVYDAYVTLEISGGASQSETGTIKLGSSIIMEGLAWEVERLLYLRENGSTVELDNRVPFNPYKLCRLIFESLTNTTPTSHTMAKVCLLALQASDPGDSFIEIASAIKEKTTSNGSVEDALGRIVEESTNALKANLSKVLNFLAPEFDDFLNRGPVGVGLGRLGEDCKRYIALRAENPFFELELIDQGLARDDLLSLLRTFPSCPIIHNEGFAPQEKSLFLLNESEPNPNDVAMLGAFQGFMQFAGQHIDKHGTLAETSQLKNTKCLFYEFCGTPLAVNETQICQAMPWESFCMYQNAKESCWYAHGVAAARAREDL